VARHRGGRHPFLIVIAFILPGAVPDLTGRKHQNKKSSKKIAQAK
jgi:hypothetical protein